MSFLIDKQTLEDLNIFRKKGGTSIYSLYNRTVTPGGAAALQKMFQEPLSDASRINMRSRIIQYFYSTQNPFPFDTKQFEELDRYLSGNDLKHVRRNVLATAKLIVQTEKFLNGLPQGDGLGDLNTEVLDMKETVTDSKLTEFARAISRRKPGPEEIADYDYLVRVQERDRIDQLLEQLYRMDAYIAVATTARYLGLTFAQVRPHTPEGAPLLRLKNLRHPALEGAVGNEVIFDRQTNMMFLTGANRAGKSTFMKALGLSVYLAHLGFPVTADEMECTASDGLVTTINLSDNLNLGFSHFNMEVHRIKQVARQIATGKHLFVIFDELFRGTNVKDAYEATVAITKALARRANCIFVISTHIIEAADELRAAYPNIAFTYIPTEMRGRVPHYTYKLAPGVTADRHGMMIIDSEGILDILDRGSVLRKS